MKAFVFLAVLALSHAKAPYITDRTRDVIPGEYIVQLHKNISLLEANIHIAAVSNAHPEAEIRRTYRIGSFSGYHLVSDENTMQQLLDNPAVSHIEPNQVVRAYDAVCTAQTEATWGLVRTTMRDLELDGVYSHDAELGKGVDAYVIDTGIFLEHEKFQKRAVWGTDEVNYPPILTDRNGHGTHVAGTIMADMFGLARKTTAIAVKVLGANGSGSTAGVIGGVEWVANAHSSKKGARSVANMSLGGGLSTAMNNAVNECVDAGVAMVVAAGNEAQDACNVSPASAERVVTVACSDNKDQLCYFSNYGACVDIIAPGMDITSTWNAGEYSTNTISGTSMSAPHVAGVAAKLMSVSDKERTPKDVLEELQTTATKEKISSIPTRGASTSNLLVFHECT